MTALESSGVDENGLIGKQFEFFNLNISAKTLTLRLQIPGNWTDLFKKRDIHFTLLQFRGKFKKHAINWGEDSWMRGEEFLQHLRAKTCSLANSGKWTEMCEYPN